MHFSVQIRPQWDQSAGTVSALDLTLKTDRPVKAGEDLAARILTIVNIPFCPMEPASFSDEAGEIPVESRKGGAEMSFIHREFYRALRDTVGETVIRYRITPRVQPEGYRSSPYFDLVAEKGGVLGTGTTFLLHPPVLPEETDFSLRWDLSGLPEGSRGVWSLGTGDCEKRLTVSDILFSAYMAGQVKAIEEGKAGFYWFGETPFPAEACAGEITRLFNYMSKLFRDKGGDYRVFTRRNHFPGGGGTALTRSYIYAYGEGDAVTVEELQSLLAHEMVHNWPTLRDDPPGAGTWYVEGSAEYYSTLIPLEMGICSPGGRRTSSTKRPAATTKIRCRGLITSNWGNATGPTAAASGSPTPGASSTSQTSTPKSGGGQPGRRPSWTSNLPSSSWRARRPRISSGSGAKSPGSTSGRGTRICAPGNCRPPTPTLSAGNSGWCPAR